MLYPVLAVTPDVVLNRKVVPAGGFTRPTVINNELVAGNPETENPLAV
jgi:hypothetical protein